MEIICEKIRKTNIIWTNKGITYEDSYSFEISDVYF